MPVPKDSLRVPIASVSLRRISVMGEMTAVTALMRLTVGEVSHPQNYCYYCFIFIFRGGVCGNVPETSLPFYLFSANSVACTSYTYKCKNNECVSKTNPECDGDNDCSDGSDEENCGKLLISKMKSVVLGSV